MHHKFYHALTHDRVWEYLLQEAANQSECGGFQQKDSEIPFLVLSDFPGGLSAPVVRFPP